MEDTQRSPTSQGRARKLLPENQGLTVLFDQCVVQGSVVNGPSHFPIRLLPELCAEDSNSHATESQRKQVFQDRRKPSPCAPWGGKPDESVTRTIQTSLTLTLNGKLESENTQTHPHTPHTTCMAIKAPNADPLKAV